MIKKETTTIQGAATRIGVKRSVVEKWIEEGRIEYQNESISLQTVSTIIEENSKYISLEKYLKQYDSELFDSKYSHNRLKYIDYLEENGFYGLKITYPEEMRFPFENRVSFYFLKKDEKKIKDYSKDFFEFFGMDEYSKTQKYIEKCHNPMTKTLLKSFLEGVECYTPKVTEFVKKAIVIDFKNANEEYLAQIINDAGLVGSKDLLISFVEFSKTELSLELGRIERRRKHTEREIGAYPYKIFVLIAKMIFNEECLCKNNVLQKCFNKSIDFETWLFLSIHYVCAWRAQDICDNWPYLSESTISKFRVDVTSIKEDILENKIGTNVYFEIGSYIEKSIELSATKAHKTMKGSDLVAPIGKELKIFFGRMALISYYHINKSEEGRLSSKRKSEYLSFVRFQDLFGKELYEQLGRNHLCSRRLNKSYIQCIEERARKNGKGTMVAYTIASYARNHADIDTTAMYLFDHGLNGEKPEVALAMMLDRGVFGSIKYIEFLTAYPEAFKKLTVEEQTRLLSECGVSAYELEIMCSDAIAEQILKDKFAEGNKEQALKILYEMFEIAQGFGKAKDKGIYCKKRALGVACVSPNFESCLANVCPYLVFTEAGIRSLVNVITNYEKKYIETGNPKYRNILDKKIYPAYEDIIKKLSENMNAREKALLKRVIGKHYDEYTKNNGIR